MHQHTTKDYIHDPRRIINSNGRINLTSPPNHKLHDTVKSNYHFKWTTGHNRNYKNDEDNNNGDDG